MNYKRPNVVMDGYLAGALGNKLFVKEYCSSSPKGKVVVVPDFGASLASYDYFASLLSKDFDVLLYDPAGQGKSEGSFSLEGAVSDLEKIVSSQSVPVALCAHSFGARIASELAKKCESTEPLKGIYMIQPCLGRESFGLQKDSNGTLSWVKKKFSGRKNALVVQSSELSAQDCVLERTPVGYMIANNDDVLFVSEDDVSHLLKLYHSVFKSRFVGIDWDDSIEAKGLNHWLNLSNGECFLKQEHGKNPEAIALRISYFFSRVFEKN
jgi:alpha-beta hydrolase superfamily lysophospholipase